MALRKIKPGERLRGIPSDLVNSVVDLVNDRRPSPSRSGRMQDGVIARLIITGFTEIDADAKWDYAVKELLEDAGSEAWGGGSEDSVTWSARNTWEDADRVGPKAGYQNDCDGLYPIPVGAVIEGTLTTTTDKHFWSFDERNEPICPPP